MSHLLGRGLRRPRRHVGVTGARHRAAVAGSLAEGPSSSTSASLRIGQRGLHLESRSRSRSRSRGGDAVPRHRHGPTSSCTRPRESKSGGPPQVCRRALEKCAPAVAVLMPAAGRRRGEHVGIVDAPNARGVDDEESTGYNVAPAGPQALLPSTVPTSRRRRRGAREEQRRGLGFYGCGPRPRRRTPRSAERHVHDASALRHADRPGTDALRTPTMGAGKERQAMPESLGPPEAGKSLRGGAGEAAHSNARAPVIAPGAAHTAIAQ